LQNALAPLGIKVASLRTSSDSAVRLSHFTHLQPNLFREGGPVAPIWTRSLGRETSLIGITRIDETQALLARGDSKLTTLSDLKGRKLALPRHQTQYIDHARAHALFGSKTILGRADLTLDDVKLTDIAEDEYEVREPPFGDLRPPLKVVAALLDGTVDAIYAAGPRVQKFITKHGFRPLSETGGSAISDEAICLGTPRAITVNRDMAQKYPEVAAEYLAVLLKTAEWAVREPMHAGAALCADLGLTMQELLAGYGSSVHRQLSVHLAPDSRMALEEQKAFLLCHGFLGSDFAFASWVDPIPLRLAEEMVQESAHVVA
jgi:ABC-type nitrate/sulfonate/bicarbonate transport system substrate-binding protein